MKISKCHVELLYGSNTMDTKKGSIKLDEKILLKDVLYVPNLIYHWIFVSQLIIHLDFNNNNMFTK